MHNPKIVKYICEQISKEDDLLKRLSRETYLKTLAPQMLSGHLQGNLLSILTRMLRPKNILEIGTFTGYATLCLAEGLSEDGRLYTIEVKPDILHIPKKYFAQSEHSDQIKLIVGDAKEIIKSLDVKFDMVFIDADKLNYGVYYDLVIDNMNKDGVILADNILWSGKVLEDKMDKTTQALHDFNTKVSNDERVQNVIIPIRDGINLIQKL